MTLHLSQFAGYIIPVAGIVAPIIIWQVKKDQLPELDEHGRIVCNWMLSAFIYFGISFLLMIVVIGIPMLWVMGALAVIFPIVGALKASNGEAWPYPGSIRFFG
jgi:uncharacterized Tic20 family protein